MKFQKITQEDLKNSIGYKISCAILNQKDDFTIDMVLEELSKNVTLQDSKDIKYLVEDKLSMFVENMVLTTHGSYYSKTNLL